jgi:hypothetical protein
MLSSTTQRVWIQGKGCVSGYKGGVLTVRGCRKPLLAAAKAPVSLVSVHIHLVQLYHDTPNDPNGIAG